MSQDLPLIFSLILLTTVMDTISHLFLKASINSAGVDASSLRKAFALVYSLLFMPRIWAALGLSVLSLLMWLLVLSKADLSFAFSLNSIHYVLIALAAKVFLGEPVEARRWLGTFLIMAGIALVSMTASTTGN